MRQFWLVTNCLVALCLTFSAASKWKKVPYGCYLVLVSLLCPTYVCMWICIYICMQKKKHVTRKGKLENIVTTEKLEGKKGRGRPRQKTPDSVEREHQDNSYRQHKTDGCGGLRPPTPVIVALDTQMRRTGLSCHRRNLRYFTKSLYFWRVRQRASTTLACLPWSRFQKEASTHFHN